MISHSTLAVKIKKKFYRSKFISKPHVADDQSIQTLNSSTSKQQIENNANIDAYL